jgi:hypothetical protein
MLSGLEDKLRWRLKNEFEIYIIMALFTVWYYSNIQGAIRQDETIFAMQGYYFFQGNMAAEQFRPMGRYFFGLGQVMFGRTTFGTKFFIPLFSVFTVYLSYKVTKLLSNRVFGIFAGVILGIIPFYGDHSVSGLMDMIMSFFVILLFYFALKYLRSEDVVEKQRLLFVLGFLSITTLATKLYGAFFSFTIFLFIIYTHWDSIRKIRLFKFKNMKKRIKKNLFLLPVFMGLGALFGLLIRAQLRDLWENAGDLGREDVLGVLPGFMDEIVLNMDSTNAMIFFLLVGLVIFFILWIIASFIGRETLRIIQSIYKKRELDRKYHVLIFLVGAVIGFIVIYSPYIHNPVSLFTQIILNQTIRTTSGAPRVIDGVRYENAPWWSYFYWTYFHLGLMFVVGLLISMGYAIFRLITKKKIPGEEKLLYLYILIPFILMTMLKVKSEFYYIMFFPLFSVLVVITIASIVKWLLDSSSNDTVKDNAKILSVLSIIILMLLPGPLWMTLEDPSLGWDSEYDTVGDMIIEGVDSYPDEEYTVIALDTLSVEFYLPDDIQKKVTILPLFSDNFSKDIIGRPYVFVPDEELLNMSQNGEIHMLVDEPNRFVDRESETREYISGNFTKIVFNEDLVVYTRRT